MFPPSADGDKIRFTIGAEVVFDVTVTIKSGSGSAVFSAIIPADDERGNYTLMVRQGVNGLLRLIL